ncbi:MAG: hypothetical protein ABLT11_00285, partial [Candidatus Acidiferrum sp.]
MEYSRVLRPCSPPSSYSPGRKKSSRTFPPTTVTRYSTEEGLWKKTAGVAVSAAGALALAI